MAEDKTQKAIENFTNLTGNQVRAALQGGLVEFDREVTSKRPPLPSGLVSTSSPKVEQSSVVLRGQQLDVPLPTPENLPINPKYGELEIYCVYNGGPTPVIFSAYINE